MNPNDKIYVAGHRGMVGSAIVRALRAKGFENLVTATSLELDLKDTVAVRAFFEAHRPDVVILAAARVGGIQANRENPVAFLYDNLMIQNNTMMVAAETNVRQYVFLGSSCIYPLACPQPMREEYLLTGPLEPTNEGYALAKIVGLRLAKYLAIQGRLKTISLMPCNLYGPNDSFDPLHSHVLSALVRKFTDAVDCGADDVKMWGTGVARREFMHVDDMAEATLFLAEHWHSPEIINVGVGYDVSIRELAEMIAEKTGFLGRFTWDDSMPDGMPRKCLDVRKLMALDYRPRVSLSDGIDGVIAEYRQMRSG